MKLKYLIILLVVAVAVSAQAQNVNISIKDVAEQSTCPRVVILDRPQSMNELLGKFKGKLIYIDVMASWCKPCLVELKKSKKLESFFKENDVIKIFISVDSPEDINKSILMIANDSLSGFFTSYHLQDKLAEKDNKFAADIKRLFLTDEDGNMRLSFPTYAIVDRKGKIHTKNIARPSNPDELKKQLRELLVH